FHHEPVDAGVDAVFRIARDHDARRDHRSAVVNGRHRDRQPEKVDLIAGADDLLVPRGLHVAWGDRMIDPVAQLLLDLAVIVAAHTHDRALTRAYDAGN